MKQPNKNKVGALLWLVFSCTIHIILFREKLDMGTPISQRLLTVILAIAVTLPLHELIHGMLMKLFGMKRVRIEFAKDPSGVPSVRAIGQGEVPGWKRTVIFLTPLVLLTLLPDILMCLNERAPFLLFVVAMCNSAGCYFDLMEIFRK